MGVVFGCVCEGAKPPHQHFHNSHTFLQNCECTYEALFALLFSFERKLPIWLGFQGRSLGCSGVHFENVFRKKKKLLKRVKFDPKVRLKSGMKKLKSCWNSRNFSRKTLFSVGHIWSNICRIWTKSRWSGRSISVVFNAFYAGFVGCSDSDVRVSQSILLSASCLSGVFWVMIWLFFITKSLFFKYGDGRSENIFIPKTCENVQTKDRRSFGTEFWIDRWK